MTTTTARMDPCPSRGEGRARVNYWRSNQNYLPERVLVDREGVLKLLAEHKPRLRERYGVTDLALFGSMARGASDADSDVDVLVAFDGPATSARYFGVMFYLEDLLGRPVDLVTVKALREELRPHVEREAVHVRNALGTRVAILHR